MKKLVIISDSHGNLKNIENLRSLFEENDYIVHLGDGAGDMRGIMRDYPEKTYVCAGNCDFFTPYSEEEELEVEGVTILCCHGHKYGVKSDLQTLANRAKLRGCEIALYGHTHVPSISVLDGVTLINPGSLRYPVGEGGSYCYLVVNGKKFTYVIVGNSLNG